MGELFALAGTSSAGGRVPPEGSIEAVTRRTGLERKFEKVHFHTDRAMRCSLGHPKG